MKIVKILSNKHNKHTEKALTKGPETYINRFVNIEAYGRKSGKCKGFRQFHLQKMTAYAYDN